MSNLLTKEKVAARADISIRKLDTLFKTGNGPRRTYIGKRAFVLEDDYQEWLSECSERRNVEQEIHASPPARISSEDGDQQTNL
jgi:hypothetical protein